MYRRAYQFVITGGYHAVMGVDRRLNARRQCPMKGSSRR